MNIVIDAVNIPTGATGGGETYFLEFLSALRQVDTLNYYTVLLHEDNRPTLEAWGAPNFDYQYVHNLRATRFKRIARQYLTRLPIFDTWLTPPADVMHWTNGVIFPQTLSTKIPAVVTLLDIQHIYFPEFFSPKTIARRNKLFAQSIHQAKAVITISEFTRQSIIEHYDADPAKISVIYLGVNLTRFNAPLSSNDTVSLRKKYNLPEKFLIYPAGTWGHKNHLRLLDAVHQVKAMQIPDIQIVLTGIQQVRHDMILAKINELGLADNVHHLGHVEWQELPQLIRLARGMIFPSLFEGFGLPIIEAMAAGCPVASSTATALDEVAGTAVYKFDPTQNTEIAEAIYKLWTDDALCHKLIEAGYAHCQQFSWAENARQTLHVYETVAK